MNDKGKESEVGKVNDKSKGRRSRTDKRSQRKEEAGSESRKVKERTRK